VSSLFSRELAVGIEAARAAGAVVRGWYDGTYTVRQKGKDNPVTEADMEANRTIHDIVLGAFPDDGWLSEETRDSAERLSKRRVWIVDPLDGTKEFINHIPEFCVCVGLVEDGIPVVGVECNPVRDELFAAARGGGTTLNGEPVRVSSQADLATARMLTSRSEVDRGEWKEFESELQLELTGSVAYKLALIAAGQADATFSLTPKNEWDVCAGAALISEAGGRFTDRFGQPRTFNQKETRLSGIIACNGQLYEPIAELLRRHGKMQI
jgi:myo-inositol-1(or 4)-monophosphatase